MGFKVLLIFIAISQFSIYSLSIKKVSYYKSGTYSIDSGLNISDKITINSDNYSGDFFITFDGGSNGTTSNRMVSDWSGNLASYNLYSDSNNSIIIKDTSTANSLEEVLAGNFTGKDPNMTLNYYIGIPPNSFSYGGQLTDTVKVSLYSGTLNSYTLVQSVNIQIAITIPNELEMSIVPKDSVYDSSKTDISLDFGELSSGAIRELDIIVKSNLGYKVQLTSKGGGALALKNTWSDKTVPYSLTVNNSQVELVPWQAVIIATGSITSVDGERIPLKFTILDFWDVQDGEYEDVITVTLSSN